MTGEPMVPAVVAFDGSDEAGEAVRQAAVVLAGRPLLIVTVWEPGLAELSYTSGVGEPIAGYMPIDPETVMALDESVHAHANQVAEAGAIIAREAGATAEVVVVADEADPAETLASVAESHKAALIVVGSRGYTGMRAKLHGSTTQKLMHRTNLPLLIVRRDH